MWERIYNFGRMLFNLSEDLKANRDNTERLEQEVRDLTTVVRQLAFELQRTRENQTHELEKMEYGITPQIGNAPNRETTARRPSESREMTAMYQQRYSG